MSARTSSFSEYFRNIQLAVTTIFEGMSITLSHMLRAPITVEYPDVDVESQLPERYRGFLNVNLEGCIACHQCEKTCPVDCILIEDVAGEKVKVPFPEGKESTKLKYPVVFRIDMAKCMFCGLCVETCPTEVIRFTRRFEGATRNIKDLTLSFVDPEEAVVLREKAKVIEAQKAAEKAAKEKAKAEKAAKEKAAAEAEEKKTPEKEGEKES